METKKKHWLFRILQGMIIGGGAILPGVSGGVLCVVFGLYQPLMELLAHPRQGLRQYGTIFLPIAVGWVLGFVVFAGVIQALFQLSEPLTILLFVGLILGTAPTLYAQAGKEGRPKSVWLFFLLGFGVIFGVLYHLQYGITAVNIAPSLFWYFFCGVLFGLSFVMPGFTCSSILISMGLFVPMTEGFAQLNFAVILPILLGGGAMMLCFGRMMNWLFRRFYPWAIHTVLGVVLASTIVIIPLEYASVAEFLLGIVAVVVGFFCARKMEKLGMEEGI